MQIDKKVLLERCVAEVRQKRLDIENLMMSYRKALNSETKSSAGNKHETGRAMLQLEMEKNSGRLSQIQKMEQLLQRIDREQNTERIVLGSVVVTDTANYFLSVSLGKIEYENEVFYAISPQSPVGKLLLGKNAGDSVQLNKKQIEIREVI